ncbi:MAG: CCA tRNA nucleotidyltransferase [Candidatus Eiseniibacteriota bacterium]
MIRRDLDPAQVPSTIVSMIQRLHAAKHAAYLVGGSVRDRIRGVPTSDWDIATSAKPESVMKLFPSAIPTGIKHGTVTVPTEIGPCEVTTFRVEHGYTDARRPDRVEFVATIEADLSRRDFTVNAIAWDPESDREVDPFGGRADIAARRIRAVGNARERIAEDGLRAIRAARFAATLTFDVEPETLDAVAGARDAVAKVAAERIRDELTKLLTAPKPSRGLEVLRVTGLLDLVLPELASCVAVPQNRYHAYDVYYHTLHSLDAAPVEKPAVRWAALFHDVGKPPTRAEKDNGDATFYNHEFEGARLAETAMTRLRFGRDTIDRVTHLVRQHMFDYRPEWTDAAVRRFVQKVGVENIADLFDLRIADNLGNGLKTGFPHYLEELRGRIEGVLAARQALTIQDLDVNGEDVMREMGLEPGPRVGEILNWLLEQVLEDPALNERQRLLRRAREAFSIDRRGAGA